MTCLRIVTHAALAAAALSAASGARAQVVEDTVIAHAREMGAAAANAQPVWPFLVLGTLGGYPLGSALGDLPRERHGTEANYRTWRVAVGATFLLGTSIAARELFIHLDGGRQLSTTEFAIAQEAYTSRIRTRRFRAMLFGAVIGAAAGFAIYAYAPGQ